MNNNNNNNNKKKKKKVIITGENIYNLLLYVFEKIPIVRMLSLTTSSFAVAVKAMIGISGKDTLKSESSR
jgi:hypothetical protein